MTDLLDTDLDAVEPPAPTFLEPEPAGSRSLDDIAPFGLTTSGQPKRTPGGRPPGRKTAPAKKAAAAALKKTPAKKAAAPRATPAVGGPELSLAEKIAGSIISGASALQKAATGAALVARMKGNKGLSTMYLADAAVIGTVAGPLAQATGLLAEKYSDKPIVQWLEKAAEVTPFAEVGAALLIGLAQIAINHGYGPARILPGTVAPEAMAASMVEQMPPEVAQVFLGDPVDVAQGE